MSIWTYVFLCWCKLWCQNVENQKRNNDFGVKRFQHLPESWPYLSVNVPTGDIIGDKLSSISVVDPLRVNHLPILKTNGYFFYIKGAHHALILGCTYCILSKQTLHMHITLIRTTYGINWSNCFRENVF